MSLSKIKKGDNVIVIAGKDKGKTGKVLRVIPKENRILVEGINIIHKHSKPTTKQQGGIVEKEAPINISNVMLVDGKTGTKTRTKLSLRDDKKIRKASHGETVFD